MAASSVIIERLNQTHDLSGFDCGNSQLNEWLKRFAWSNDRAESARTYTAHRANRVVGYHSLVAGSALKHETPARIAKGLANHPVGLILLARLAVESRRTRQGPGESAAARCSCAHCAGGRSGWRPRGSRPCDRRWREAFLSAPRFRRIAGRSVPIDDADEGSASFALGGRHAARGTCVYQVRLSRPFAVAIEFVRSRVLR